MNKLPNTPCRKCGGDTKLTFISSSGMDITPTGLKRTCLRCGYGEFIKSLDEGDNKEFAKE
jgi:predicted nucleic-acid-binding Zn-ribbon protein